LKSKDFNPEMIIGKVSGSAIKVLDDNSKYF